jgi:hypothetical protein
MSKQYRNLKEIKKAFDEGRLKGACMHLWENESMLYDENNDCVFIGEEHRETLLEALTLLGIPSKFE